MKVGFSAIDISRDGKNNPDDPVYAKAIVFRYADKQAAIVICDLISVSGEMNVAAREIASIKSGIPVENICLSATHTHTNSNSPVFQNCLMKLQML